MAERKGMDWRISLVSFLLFLGLTVVAGKLLVIQGLEAGRYRRLAEEQRDTVISVTPRRGTVIDREGEIMAISEDMTTVYATPYQVEDKEGVARKIASVLGSDPDEILDKLKQPSGFVYIARKIDNALAERLKNEAIEGIGYIEESKRFYPLGSLFSQVVGIVDVDNKGSSGMELCYEDILGGKGGEILLERDAAGNPIPGSEEKRLEAVDGVDLQMTLDKDIQARLEESLENGADRYGARAATGVVMDCNTGAILAMATSPTFDPNKRESLDQDEMRNRAVTDIYEPGSVMKVLTAAAALEEGVVNGGTVLQVQSELAVADMTFKDAEPQPSRQLTFTQVISQSSNVGTIQVAMELGPEQLSSYQDLLGLGQPTGIDFPGEVDGLVPPYNEWSGTSAATMSIGQGISVTPIQIACVLGCIANGGRKVTPHLLQSRLKDKESVDMGLGGLGERVLSEETCSELTGILEQVVTPGNTGVNAAVDYYRVAGKTGTAAKPLRGGGGYGDGYMATFAGFAPAEDPRLVCLIVFDEPSPIWGGDTAAPVFSEVMGFSLQHLKVPPSFESPPQREVE